MRSKVTGSEEEWKNFYDSLNAEQSDRARVLVAGAFIDGGLERLLRTFMKQPLNEEDATTLFRPSGPLGSMSMKIRFASCLGLMGPRMRSDLETVTSVRNDFAHEFATLSFSHQSVRDRILNLSARAGVPEDRKDDPQVVFLLAVSHLTSELEFAALTRTPIVDKPFELAFDI